MYVADWLVETMTLTRPYMIGVLQIWKEILNSDGQQFQLSFHNHQYQQNKQLPITSSHWTWKMTTTCDIANSGHCLGQAQNCGRVKAGNCIVR